MAGYETALINMSSHTKFIFFGLNILVMIICVVQLRFRQLARVLPYILTMKLIVLLSQDVDYDYISYLVMMCLLFQATYCDLVSNLAFFTLAIVIQQIIIVYTTDQEHYNYVTATTVILLLNIILSSILHIIYMCVGKYCLDLKQQILD